MLAQDEGGAKFWGWGTKGVLIQVWLIAFCPGFPAAMQWVKNLTAAAQIPEQARGNGSAIVAAAV